jgi:outer membrane protein, multidrug efflux system
MNNLILSFKKYIKKRLLCICLMPIVCLSSCTLAPTMEKIALPVPIQFPSTPTTEYSNLSPSPKLDWKNLVVPANLQKIVKLALENNRDLRISALNIEKFQAQYRIVRASLTPSINATAAEVNSLTPANLTTTGNQAQVHNVAVGLGFSNYEVDVFGKLRDLKEQALEQYLGTEQAFKTVRLSLIAQICSVYYTLIADEGHYVIANNLLQNQKEILDISQKIYEQGILSEAGLNQVKASYHLAEMDLSRYANAISQDKNLLTLLVGTSLPEDLYPKSSFNPSNLLIGNLPADLPATVLTQRPDVLEAEHLLKAANANIGVARAAFFPSITITGLYGTASADMGTLFTPGQLSWSFIPQISLPIFNAGAIAANLSASKANQKIYLANYERVIQYAFREVSDNLTIQSTLNDELSHEIELIRLNENNLQITSARFKHGVDNYLTKLLVQRNLYLEQQNLLNLQLAKSINLINLYKSLGGDISF